MKPDLDFDEVEVIAQLRRLREHGWGTLVVAVQAGDVRTIRLEEVFKCENNKKLFDGEEDKNG